MMKYNNYSVRIVGHTISPSGHEIYSFECEYPRFILAEVNTHRIISRSSASSRAIPVKRRLQMVAENPVAPVEFGKNRPGMQAKELMEGDELEAALKEWFTAAQDAKKHAERLMKMGVHKQVANRLLEPFVTVRTVMTATEWDNWFALRMHEDAQPEIRVLAKMMWEEKKKSVPVERELHLPYITEDEFGKLSGEVAGHDIYNISAARCARVSYKTHDGDTPSVEADLELARKLLDAGHLSPFDHPAVTTEKMMRDDARCRQFVGWCSYRVIVEHEHGMFVSNLNSTTKEIV